MCAGTWRSERRSAFRRASWCRSVNEPGSLAQVAQVIAEHDGNIDNIRMDAPRAGFHLGAHRSRSLSTSSTSTRSSRSCGRRTWWRSAERVNA